VVAAVVAEVALGMPVVQVIQVPTPTQQPLTAKPLLPAQVIQSVLQAEAT
jgi:hypothetical protein